MTDRPRTFMNVWEPLVSDYLLMGWMVENIIHPDRGGHSTWLMVWPCSCPAPYIHHRYAYLGEEHARTTGR